MTEKWHGCKMETNKLLFPQFPVLQLSGTTSPGCPCTQGSPMAQDNVSAPG